MLNEPFVAEKPPCHCRNTHRNYHREEEAPGFFLHAVHQIHTEHRGDECGDHHDDRDGGQRTHHRVHIVVDDAGIGVHRRLQDIGIDAGGLSGLRHLDIDVFDQVGIEFIDLEFELQFLHQVLVAPDRGLEIGERILQTAEAYQTLVVHLTVEIALGLVDEHRNLLQTLQIPDGTGEEQAEDHVNMIRKALIALLLVRHEVDHHVRLVVADGNGDVALMDDTQRHSGIRRPRPYLLDIGDTEDDEHPAIVVFITGPLIGIADVRHEIIGNVELLFEFALVWLSPPWVFQKVFILLILFSFVKWF